MSLVLRWLGQSFWNYFDWNNIVLYLYLTTLYGVEFQVRDVKLRCLHSTSSLSCVWCL